ncbi:MAG: HNH endonuclease [Actinomycetia bacterium]|nr:HNH endonuclease [Actinomycetes bacterium]MCP4221795.1 HNH endonuclease [Actinomycetes bacterium]MCP5034371.1 HNH endonuclease [Actinomycetes bacterium]
MSRALVLNATYEPIGVVSGRRAVILALDEKVDVLADTGHRIESARLSLAVPSVIRLRYYVKVPYKRTAPLSRRAVFARDQGKCQYCGRSAESIDHVVPRSKGGPHSWDNVVACCRRCNTYKGDRLLADCSLELKTEPKAPTQYVWVKVAAGTVPAAWTPYLEKSAA